MRARPYKQSTGTAHPEPVSNEYTAEALALQAARRPARTPAKTVAPTPMLPRVAKPHRPKRRQDK